MIEEEEVNFDAFVGLVESNEKNQAQTKSNQKGFDFPVCCGVNDKAIVRFVNGMPESALDQGKPGSGRAKLFNIGWVKDDNNKTFLLVLPAIVNNKPMYNHTMIEFIDKVLSRTWIENPNAGQEGQDKGSWKYFYADRDDYGQQSSGEMTLKQIFWKVFKSGADPNKQFYKTQKSWRGQTIYVANVIDRLDYKWHQENKKTKLLMRKVGVKDGKVTRKELSFYAIGSSLKELTDSHGTKLNYDVLITPGAEAKDKYILKNLSKLKTVNYWDEVSKYVTDDDKAKVSTDIGLTEEEKTWEAIDIGRYYRFTPARVILDHFGRTIKNFDIMVGTNFYQRFEEEAKADAKAEGKEYKPVESKPAAQTAPAAAANVAPVQAAPAATSAAPQQAAPVQSPNFDSMSPAGVPVDVAPSAEAQNDISTFYDSLDD